MYHLKLYVTGRTPTSEKLIADLMLALDSECAGQYELEVLDVFDYPEAAYDDMVLATPTLIRTLPPPVRRLVGDLNDRERVLAGLELRCK